MLHLDLFGSFEERDYLLAAAHGSRLRVVPEMKAHLTRWLILLWYCKSLGIDVVVDC